MKLIKVILWGLGAMGSGMARDLILNKKGIEIVGAIDSSPKKRGRDLGDIIDLGRSVGVKVTDNPEQVLKAEADIVLLSTSSFVREVLPLLKMAAESGKNVITLAEQMSAPQAQNMELAKEIDDFAKKNCVTILGTGINPGFVLDTLVIALTGVCQVVKKIHATRINDLSPFGPSVMKTQGVGVTAEAFYEGVKQGAIVGHIGFQESLHLISTAIGWKLDRVEETREPIITTVYRETPHVQVKPGMVAGCRHIARGYIGDEAVITLEHPQQIHPGLEGVKTGDVITIEGTPTITFADTQEVPGGIGTMAAAVNMIPRVINARPGLVTMPELPLIGALMGDVRELIHRQ